VYVVAVRCSNRSHFWPAAMDCEVFVLSTAQDSGLERISVCQECPDRVCRQGQEAASIGCLMRLLN
jgi:hypothetical protein